ncbi:MAG: transglutaminase domain-containing protein, partial [Chloroflexota bacterium]|nr:transglutaminase domain-containing protein [Anaerolineales bacterium]
ANDFIIAKGEDQNYLRSILKIIFPDGTAGLSEEQISIEILRYVTSALDLKDNSGSATKILREGYAICGGRGVSFETLVRLIGIPARWVNIYGLVSQGGHTVVEVYYDGQWHLYDPTYGTFFYSKPEYDKSGVVSSLNELVTESPEEWYVFKVVNQPWGEYDESTRSFGIVRAEDDYLADFYGYTFFDQYRQMFATTFPVAYDSSQIISFPVVADLTQEGSFSVGSVDNSDSDTIAATTAAETAGKTGMYYLVGETHRQYVHTWFIKTSSPGLVRITYYSTENMPPVLMLFPLKGAYAVSALQDGKKAEFLLRVSDPDASVQFWSSDDIFWVDAVQAEWLGASTDVK